MANPKRKTSSQIARLEEALERELGGARPNSARRRTPAGMERRVRDVLIPVEPSQQFVMELGRSLMATAARSRQSLVRRYRTAIVIGAALFGSIASLVGVVALIVRQRSRMRTEITQ
jgi:hypothetical protein